MKRFSEEARTGYALPWVNSDICICSPEILAHIPAGRAYDLPPDIFINLAGSRRLFGFPLSGYRCAVDSPERLAAVNEAVALGCCCVDPFA